MIRLIDLRSDTFTKPSPAMREAIAHAEVGDDVFGEDPTVNRLQEKVASMLGMEAALFVASGTMGNQVAINAHTQPGDEVILEGHAHIFYYEAGAPALLSGVQLRTLPGVKGVISAEQVEEAIRPENVHFPPTRLICLENTHNRSGGTIFPLDEIRRIRELSEGRGIRIHLDGARLWNASVATGISLKEYGRYFDSISVCFSKGMGAPVGSMLVGNRDFIKRAHRYRKIYGGGMRQVGILAAAALYAVENNIARLAEDHRNARKLAEAVAKLPGLSVDLETVQTNIIIMKVEKAKYNAPQVVEDLKKRGVLLLAVGPIRLRAVTHLDVSEEDIDEAVETFKDVFSG
ncbi:MAG: low-specificity L-threonine aldolase [bacterium]